MAVAVSPLVRSIDVEDLVVWACRDQQALRDRSSLHVVEAAAQFGMRCSRQRLSGADFPGAWGVDSCARVAAIGAVGTRIDGKGPTRGIAPRLPPDAEAVAAAIEALPVGERRLVRKHGQAGTRPDWLPLLQPLVMAMRPSDQPGRYRHQIAGEWQPIAQRSEFAARCLARGESLFDAHGRRRLVEEEKGFRFRAVDGGRELFVRWCPVEPEHSDAKVIEANCDWVEWHTGLSRLVGALRGKLIAHRITGLAIPARPWEQKPC